jgi:hypothetical protein
LDLGAVYPSLGRLREVSVAIAVAVAENMFHTDRATKPLPLSSSARYRAGDKELLAVWCRQARYTPSYEYESSDAPMYIRSRL